ncbi:MAG: hypothetical protein L6R38_003565 [Xanthoria sp. 2 TBL-2021]|nr:MAG: hypothetical protein L6R38_003565 [Xanthoria sp. 2 TBL-2021]
MHMAIYTCLLIAFLCPLPIWAGPLSIDSLSPYLSAIVPTCAHGCLRSFVADSFPSSTCKSQSDIDCLCTRDSKTGLTLGEGALRCLAAECGKNSTAIGEAIRVYEVCHSVPQAKPMTHPTLTATQVIITTVPYSKPPTSIMSEEATETEPSSPTPPFISPSATEDVQLPSDIVADTRSLPTPSSTTSNAPTAQESLTEPSTFNSVTSFPTNSQSSPSITAAAASASRPVLTKPQIAGVTVGSVAVAGIIFGLLALFFCLRSRRDKRWRASDASFGNDKIVIDEPRKPSPPLAPAVQDVERGIRGPEVSEPYDQRTEAAFASPQSNNRWSLFSRGTKPEDIGVAVAPGPVQQTPHDRSPITPVSAASYETTSRLLPDKPTYSLYPPPLRLSSYNTHVNPIDVPGTQAVDFARIPLLANPRPAPRGRGTMDTSQTYLHLGQPTLRHVPSDPFLESTSSAHLVPSKQYQTRPSQRPRAAAPALAPAPAPAPASVAVQYGHWTEPMQVPRKPVPARRPTHGPPTSVQDDRPDGTPALPSCSAISAAGPSTALGAAQPIRRKSSGRPKVSGKRPTTFLSTTSDTSFEDADSDDEPPPPLPQSTLSPVVESPASRPRVAGVRYPVIPTSAAMSPSINQTIREVPRGQIELNPASDRSKGKAKISPKTPSPRDKPVPALPELAGSPLGERQQGPDSSSDRVKPGSAKWNILVAPGLDGIENIGTPKSMTSGEWTPLSTPTRRGR